MRGKQEQQHKHQVVITWWLLLSFHYSYQLWCCVCCFFLMNKQTIHTWILNAIFSSNMTENFFVIHDLDSTWWANYSSYWLTDRKRVRQVPVRHSIKWSPLYMSPLNEWFFSSSFQISAASHDDSLICFHEFSLIWFSILFLVISPSETFCFCNKKKAKTGGGKLDESVSSYTLSPLFWCSPFPFFTAIT